MNEIILPHKRWQQIFNLQMIFALIIIFIEIIQENKRARLNWGSFVILLIIIGLNYYVQYRQLSEKKLLSIVVRWINLFVFSSLFTELWLSIGNYFLLNYKQLQILWVLLLWAVYLVLLLPLAVLYAGKIRNWFFALIAVKLLEVQYGSDSALLISKNLPWMHSLTYQGVIAAFAIFNIACFLGYAWGYHLNPNLKFIKSKNFQKSVLIVLLVFATIDLFYNSFNTYDSNIWSVFFSYSVSFDPTYFTIANFTSAVEPGILEETERYLTILILLAGFNRFTKWRVPVAVYGSGILFGLSHLSNVGWHGETLSSTIAQVIGVMGGGFLWAVIYLYSGKIWITMIFHFLLDYLANLQSGWNSAGWNFSGTTSDYLFEIVTLLVSLIVTIWMMYGQRRAVLEQNADRLLNLKDEKLKYLLTRSR